VAAPPATGLQRLSAQSRVNFWRSLQTLNLSRVVIAVVLLAYLSLGSGAHHFIQNEICLIYLALALGFALLALYGQRRFLLQLSAQIGLDIVIISLLYLYAGGARSALAMLYLFPLAGVAILAPLSLALLCAALVSLFLLAEGLYQVLMLENEMALMQAGLYGAALFALVLVVSKMAARLIKQEELAVQRGCALAIEQAINALVMADIEDGIVVVDQAGCVMTVNPAATQMLGPIPPGVALSDQPRLQSIARAHAHWLADASQSFVLVAVKGQDQGAWREAARLKLHFAAADTAALAAQRCVIFLQDVTAIENQAQQLKLAAMGRLTASIAHEVRNPLSAIGHATALLGEDMSSAPQLRLLKIVRDNVARVNRMVEDILQLSRKVQPHNGPLNLGPFLAELKTEFQEIHALAPDIIALEQAGPATVGFDPLHLREIVLNLLSNAVRHASGSPASVRLTVLCEAGAGIALQVQDDGVAISSQVRSHLFEPFYTRANQGGAPGLGLGLYVARELCLNNGALLDYEYRCDDGQAGGRFVVTFGSGSRVSGSRVSGSRVAGPGPCR
jgi:two-component system sensor histidine kinase PilS (NtrC family)